MCQTRIGDELGFDIIYRLQIDSEPDSLDKQNDVDKACTDSIHSFAILAAGEVRALRQGNALRQLHPVFLQCTGGDRGGGPRGYGTQAELL